MTRDMDLGKWRVWSWESVQDGINNLLNNLLSLKTTFQVWPDVLQSKCDGVAEELMAYKLGDLNGDGMSDIRDVETLIKLSSYSSEETALSLLIEEAGITLNDIADLYGKVEFYTLYGKLDSKPTQSGVYIIKKNGETKMIVVKK